MNQDVTQRPLSGKRIVITRARSQAGELICELEKLGAWCIEIPTIEIFPPEDIQPLKKALSSINDYDWVVFTSVNGVSFFFNTLYELKKGLRLSDGLKFACTGPATEERLKEYGIISHIMPGSYSAEGLVKSFSGIEIKGKKVLLARAKAARRILPEELSRMGAQVNEVIAYETRMNKDGQGELTTHLTKNTINAITFTSSSTVSSFMSQLGIEKAQDQLKHITTACIGPITSATVKSYGIVPDVEAKEYTISGLVNALLHHFLN
tara:strand:- start:1820 stop:2614 length:795 start_codon:yes stop_codon:yes gene_type:complete